MTIPGSLLFLSGQVGYVRRHGFSVHVVTSPGEGLAEFAEKESVGVDAIPMPRAITPLQDVAAVLRLYRALRRIRPDIVHSHTPKGGLLGMIAAFLARTPARIYHMRGLPFVTESGWRRRLLRTTEWISCSLAHRVIAVSHSMRTIAVDEGLCSPRKITVLLGGSGNGVDAVGRFQPTPASTRSAERSRNGIPADALVIGFVGRLNRDKGIVELASAWKQLRESDPRLHLLIVGSNEIEDDLREVVAALESDPRVHMPGAQDDMPRMYSAMDVVALPTYREGFPNVALEAAAMQLPIVATRVPGCVDAVQDGVTGLLIPVRDPEALAEALRRYLSDPHLRAAHGEAGRALVLRDFRQEGIWDAIVLEYRRLLSSRDRS